MVQESQLFSGLLKTSLSHYPLLKEGVLFAVGVSWCFINDSSVSRPHCFAGYIKGYPMKVGVSGIDSVGMLSAFQGELGNT